MTASVTSTGASPVSGLDFQSNSPRDADETLWTLLRPGSSAPSNAAFSFSQASLSGAFSSYVMLNSGGHQARPPLPGSLSSVNLEIGQPPSFVSSNYGDMGNGHNLTSVPAEGQFIADGQWYAQPEGNVFDGHAPNQGWNQTLDLLTEPSDFSTFLNSLGPVEQQPPPNMMVLDIPQPFQSGPDVPPWSSEALHTTLEPHTGTSPLFTMEGSGLVSPESAFYQSPSEGTPPTASPPSPSDVKLETSDSSRKRKPKAASGPITMPRTRGTAGVRKKKAANSAPRSSVSSSSNNSGSQFLVITPDSINAHAGRPNPYQCFEAAQASRKGRKGPLLDEAKQNSLQVRRVGACFCCHARKVRCDMERPCRNCTKLMTVVPQAVCWQFQDFQPVLFPGFIRAHFRPDEMAWFAAHNIAGFTVDGAERPCAVELFSGAAWTSTFRIEAKFFQPNAPEVLQHWHMQVGRNCVDLQPRSALPIALEMRDGGGGSLSARQRDEIRKKTREYIASIIQEPRYAEQVTDSLRHTDLPRKLLKIVQRYAQRSADPMVNQALSIYAMHYVMTRHLCLTQRCLASLRGGGGGTARVVPQDGWPWVTPRVLNRQIKSVVSEMLAREVQLLFEAFSRRLKPRRRGDWAPCLAAFLVLCLFMEAVETASDVFVMSLEEIDIRSRRALQWRRPLVLEQNRELENLPFRKFAHQFHQIYATHAAAAEASAKAFNPLVDEASLQQVELDAGAVEMVFHLRQFITDKSSCRSPHSILNACAPGFEVRRRLLRTAR